MVVYKLRKFVPYISGARCPRSGCQHGQVLVRASFCGVECCLLVVSSHGRKKVTELSEIPFISVLIPFIIITTIISEIIKMLINNYCLAYNFHIYFNQKKSRKIPNMTKWTRRNFIIHHKRCFQSLGNQNELNIIFYMKLLLVLTSNI